MWLNRPLWYKTPTGITASREANRHTSSPHSHKNYFRALVNRHALCKPELALAKVLLISQQDVQSFSPANIEQHLGEIFEFSVADVKQLPTVVITTLLNVRAAESKRSMTEPERSTTESKRRTRPSSRRMRSQQSRVIAQRREDERNDMELKLQSERVASGLRGFLGFAPVNGGSTAHAPLVTPLESNAADDNFSVLEKKDIYAEVLFLASSNGITHLFHTTMADPTFAAFEVTCDDLGLRDLLRCELPGDKAGMRTEGKRLVELYYQHATTS